MVPRLITIALSHFCEKARWALDHAGIPFREDSHVPVFHMIATRRAKGRTVPTLVTSEGTLTDSTDILRWANERAAPDRRIYPREPSARDEVLALEEYFDEELGPHVRRAVYFHLLPERALALAIMNHGTPAHERAVLGVLYPLLRKAMIHKMRITALEAQRSTDQTLRVFEDVSRRLSDGRPFLLGDTFGAADLTFASLVGPALGVPGYFVPLPPLDDLPPVAASLARLLRDTPAGAFAQRMYAEKRRVVRSPAS